MVTTRTRMHRFLCAAVAGSLAFLAAGCGDGDDGKAVDEYVTADELCGGRAVTKDAVKALEVITGKNRFAASGEDSTVAAAAEKLTGLARLSARDKGDICWVFPEDSANELRIRWEFRNAAPKGPPHPKFTLFPMGVEAGAAYETGYVTFACDYKDQPDYFKPAYISAWVEPIVLPKSLEGDEKELEIAQVTVAHSFALALSKELGCAGNAGLKAEPSLIPKS